MPDKNACNQKVDGGSFCRAYHQRYYYNSEANSCMQFIWLGCGGNLNNFESKESCENACVRAQQTTTTTITTTITTTKPVPTKPVTTTTTVASTNKPSVGQFDNKSCEIEPFIGYCRAIILRYYYDKNTNSCSTFIFSGCGGNPNNFKTYEECIKRCYNL